MSRSPGPPTEDTPRPRHHGHKRNLSAEVSESARLELVIAHATHLDIADAIASATTNGPPATPTSQSSIPAVAQIIQRESLFYDERLPIFVVLQILAPLDDALFEHYLARLAVSLEVTAVDGSQKRQSEFSGRREQDQVHLLYQTVIDEKENPRIPIKEASRRLVVWKLEVPLGHPRVRINNPKVVITCSATLRPAELQKPLHDEEYLTMRQPMGINLLEPFATDPSLAATAPRLSALRVSRVIPVTQSSQPPMRPMGYAAKRGFSIYPAINIRLRYSRIMSGNKQTVIASLDLEVTSFSECSVTIKSVDVAVAGGRAEPLSDSASTALPLTCKPRDDMTFLYHLTQVETSSSNAASPQTSPSSTLRLISVSLEATAQVSDLCRPTISTHWTTTVDFAPPPPPSFTPSTGIQRAHRPPSLGQIIHGATVSASAGIRPSYGQQPPGQSPSVVFTPPGGAAPTFTSTAVAAPVPLSPSTALDSPVQGLTVTFTGPSRVYVGEVFTWSVFVVNRSTRTRKLALIVPPKRRKVGEGKVLPAPPLGDPPEPVIDDGMVFQTHRSQYLEPAELVPLVNDVRVGPLMPSACHTAELRFVALATGLLGVEGVRVVDLNTNETTDCRELPCIVSVGKR